MIFLSHVCVGHFVSSSFYQRVVGEHRGVPASSDEKMNCDVEFAIVPASGEWQKEEQASFCSQT